MCSIAIEEKREILHVSNVPKMQWANPPTIVILKIYIHKKCTAVDMPGYSELYFRPLNLVSYKEKKFIFNFIIKMHRRLRLGNAKLTFFEGGKAQGLRNSSFL